MRPLIALLVLTAILLVACSTGEAQRARIATPSATAPPAATTAPSPTIAPPPRTVVLDPGHGGGEVGASANGVVEKDSNLDMTRRAQRQLEARGIRAVLTRSGDTHATGYERDASLSGFRATRADLQARVDLSNREGADLFVSIHSNGSTNTAESGVEVWFDPNRPFGDDNERLARILQQSVLDALLEYGYVARDRGTKDDSCFRVRSGRCRPLYILGPARNDAGSAPPVVAGRAPFEAYAPRATGMPGALVELLFISNAANAAALRDEGAREAMARGVAEGIMAFLDAR